MAFNSRVLSTALGLAATLLVATPVAQAFNFGDIMNPSRWMGGGRNDYYDDYYGGPWGPGYGYGLPGYGGFPGYGLPGYGYGLPGYGYGLPGYGYGVSGYGVPGYAPGLVAPAAPAATSDAKDKEIEALKRRIDQLESRQGAPAAAPPAGRPAAGADGWPSAPAFRPMDQY